MFCVFANLLSAQGPTSESKELQKDSKKSPKKAPRQVFFRRAEKTVVWFLKNVSKDAQRTPRSPPGRQKAAKNLPQGGTGGSVGRLFEPFLKNQTNVFSKSVDK